MKLLFKLFFNGIIAVAMIPFFSCEDNTQALKDLTADLQDPLGTAYNIRMVYTDSAAVKAILTAPKHVDYTNLSFQYSEFPEGLKVLFFDDQGNENQVIADYGILYNDSKLIDLKGHVQLLSHEGAKLTTQQLYWDSKSEWLFTEQPFTFEDKEYNFNPVLFVSNRDFTKFQTGTLIGTVAVSEPIDSLETP